jgi:hypothetical protein
MSSNGLRPRRATRTAGFGLWILVAAMALFASGCGVLAQQTDAPRPSTSIRSFMQQPRPEDALER